MEDGAASAAGIRKGDIILSIDGVKINDGTTLQEQIGKRRPNDKVNLSVKRGSTVKQFDVVLRNKAGKTELLTRESVDVAAALGGKLVDAGERTCQKLDIDGGVEVVSVKQGGLLARARVREGFIITHINDRRILTIADLRKLSDKVSTIDGIYPDGRAASYAFVE